MKRYICSLLLGMAFGGEMFAVADNFSAFPWQAEEQVKEVPNPEKMAKRRTDEMNELLQLSEKQYKKIYKLYLKQEKEKVERMTENICLKEGVPQCLLKEEDGCLHKAECLREWKECHLRCP